VSPNQRPASTTTGLSSTHGNHPPAGERTGSSAAAERVYDELSVLAELMPERYREVFCFRWGLRGQFTHLSTQAARKFEIPKGTVEEMLNRCLWNLARRAHRHDLPSTEALLGENPAQWAERAWRHAERRWGNNEAQFSETVLLLAVAGLDVPEAHRAARQHMIDIGIARTNKWGTALTEQQRVEGARYAVDRIVGQLIWPSETARLRDLSAFTLRRPLPEWAPAKTGVFYSEKLRRLVQFDSTLELLILRQLDTDPRIVSYQEQPITIPYVLDGQARDYTPDIVVQLNDGRAFVIEAKPQEHLGEFDQVMKWASLARYCGRHGLGFWIGSPERSLIEHRCVQPNPERHDLIAAEVKCGPISGGHYQALERLVGKEQLGLVATADLLDWRADPGYVKRAEGADRDETRRFWTLIDEHSETHSTEA
jgi:TnsA endonuclease N terminal